MIIEHNFKTLYRNKKKNSLLIIQFCFSFIILFFLYSMLIHAFSEYNSTKNIDKTNLYIGSIKFNGDYKIKRNLINQNLFQNKSVENFALCSQNAPYSIFRVLNFADYNSNSQNIDVISTSSSYFDLLNLKFSKGQSFSENGIGNDIVITETLSNEWFNTDNPIGKNITLGSENSKQKLKIVGVIQDYKHINDYTVLRKAIFKSIQKTDFIDQIIIKKDQNIDNYNFENELYKGISKIDKNWEFEILEFAERSKIRNNEFGIPIFIITLIVVFLIINVILGVSGMLSMNIKKRSKEIGIRRAIGSTKTQIYWQIIFEMFLISSASIIIGIVITLLFPILENIGLSNYFYIETISLSIFTIYLISLIALLVPSWKATKVDPIETLR